MAPEESFQQQLGLAGSSIDTSLRYFPATYGQDGFIHATKEPNKLLNIGTHFYKSSIGSWVCIELDTNLLGAPVIYEAGGVIC